MTLTGVTQSLASKCSLCSYSEGGSSELEMQVCCKRTERAGGGFLEGLRGSAWTGGLGCSYARQNSILKLLRLIETQDSIEDLKRERMCVCVGGVL
jgi:hypothetical protein